MLETCTCSLHIAGSRRNKTPVLSCPANLQAQGRREPRLRATALPAEQIMDQRRLSPHV